MRFNLYFHYKQEEEVAGVTTAAQRAEDESVLNKDEDEAAVKEVSFLSYCTVIVLIGIKMMRLSSVVKKEGIACC